MMVCPFGRSVQLPRPLSYHAKPIALVIVCCLTLGAIAHAQDADSGVTVGTAAPDFRITTEDNDFTLSSLEESAGYGGKYTVLVFARAHW